MSDPQISDSSCRGLHGSLLSSEVLEFESFGRIYGSVAGGREGGGPFGEVWKWAKHCQGPDPGRIISRET